MSDGLTFYELAAFMRDRDAYFGDDENFRDMQNALIAKPTLGDVIKGAGKLRKMRWADKRRGKGKRGGLRVIYLLVPEASAVALIAVYDKDKTADLSVSQKREAESLAERTRREILEMRGLA